MQRISDANAVTALPAVPSLAGLVTGYFTNGTPGVQAPTIVPDWWLNMVQEELNNLLAAAALPVDGSASVLQAVSILGRRYTPISTSGAFVVTNGVYRLRARLWGAGGSGGTSSSPAWPGGGGGGGGYSEKFISVIPGQTVAATVGQGAPAAPGGTTSFGSFVSASGGLMGAAGTSSAIGAGGSGGNGLSGDINLSGTPGSNGFNYGSANTVEGGRGGAAFGSGHTFASGGASAGFNANQGAFPGGGASGCTAATAAGGNGFIILEY